MHDDSETKSKPRFTSNGIAPRMHHKQTKTTTETSAMMSRSLPGDVPDACALFLLRNARIRSALVPARSGWCFLFFVMYGGFDILIGNRNFPILNEILCPFAVKGFRRPIFFTRLGNRVTNMSMASCSHSSCT